MGSEPAWNRLHPSSLWVNILPQAWRMVRGYWYLLLLVLVGFEAGVGGTDLYFLGFFFMAAVLRTTIHWAVLRYRVRDDRLEIRTGLLNRQVRLISPERIQNAERVRNPIHRLAGLVEVRLETAGGQETEGLLSALSLPQADALMAELEALRRRADRGASRTGPTRAGDGEPDAVGPGDPPSEDAERGRVRLENSIIELLAHGLTAQRAGVFAVTLVLLAELSQHFGPSQTRSIARDFDLTFIAGTVLLLFVLGWILGTGNSLLRHYRFRFREQDGRFVTEQGLFTRRRVELPRHRIQLVRVDEPLLRRLMGYATAHLETAGLGVGPEGVRQAEAVLPMVSRRDLGPIFRLVFPGAGSDSRETASEPDSAWEESSWWGGALHPVPGRALAYLQARALRTTVLFTVLSAAFFWPWGLAAILSWPVFAVSAFLDWRWQAWRFFPRFIVARRGFWVRRTWILPREKIQSTHRLQGPVLRIYGLGRVLLRMAGTRVPLPPLLWEDTATCIEDAASHADRSRGIRNSPRVGYESSHPPPSGPTSPAPPPGAQP